MSQRFDRRSSNSSRQGRFVGGRGKDARRSSGRRSTNTRDFGDARSRGDKDSGGGDASFFSKGDSSDRGSYRRVRSEEGGKNFRSARSRSDSRSFNRKRASSVQRYESQSRLRRSEANEVLSSRSSKDQEIPSSEANRFGANLPDDLVWGRHATQAVLEAGRPIHRIWCTAELRTSSKFLQLLRESKASGVLVEEVSWARLGQITGGAVHQGIALQTAAAETLDLKSLIQGCNQIEESPLLLAVDGLTDPQNLGAIVRSAEALGAHGLVVPQRRSAGLTGSVAKVAAGALEHIPVARVVNLNRSLVALKDEGYRVIGLAEEGDLTISEVDLEGPLVVVTGSEAQGLSLLTRRHCDQLVRIPLRGLTPSLNASVATAIVLYEAARRGWMKGLSGQAPSPRMVRPKCSPLTSSKKDEELTTSKQGQLREDFKNASSTSVEENGGEPLSGKFSSDMRLDLDMNSKDSNFDKSIHL